MRDHFGESGAGHPENAFFNSSLLIHPVVIFVIGSLYNAIQDCNTLYLGCVVLHGVAIYGTCNATAGANEKPRAL